MRIESISKEVSADINKIANVPNEYIEQVFIEVQDGDIEGWREKSGVLIHSKPSSLLTTDAQLNNLWVSGYMRLFISHKAEFKQDVAAFKGAMSDYGVSCFVAHEDIEPTKQWQSEIERALFSMDILLAWMTENFSESNWTDQEIGVAIGREIPILSVRFGKDPYGFIGKFQAVPGYGKNVLRLAKEIYDLFWTMPRIEPKLIGGLVASFADAYSFKHAERLLGYIKKISNTSPDIVERVENAFNENSQVNGSFAVKRELPDVLKRLRERSNNKRIRTFNSCRGPLARRSHISNLKREKSSSDKERREDRPMV